MVEWHNAVMAIFHGAKVVRSILSAFVNRMHIPILTFTRNSEMVRFMSNGSKYYTWSKFEGVNYAANESRVERPNLTKITERCNAQSFS